MKFASCNLALALLAGTIGSFAASAADYQPAQWNLEARQKFADQRFGIFIVFGLYSNYSQGEWYLHHPDCRKDPEAYERMIDGFCPSKFDAKEWVGIVKDSGAKYITITTRHHDGFAIWPSKVDEWNIKNTPFKRDVIGELDAECQKQGIQLNLYYSLLDWHRSDYPPGGACKPVVRPRQPNYASYKKYMMDQIDELCTNYHPGNIWFDGEWDHIDKDRGGTFDWEFDDIFDLIHSHKVLVINNNHKKIRDKEDIQTFERDLPGDGTLFSKGTPVARDRPLEQSDVLQKNVWGYRIGEHDFLTPEQVVSMTVKCAARNSNMLMNVGPDGSGRFPRQCVEILAAVGKWFRANGDSIYGTWAGGVELGKGQVVSTRKEGTLFIHFLDPEVKEFSFLVDGAKRTVRCERAKGNGYDVVVPVKVGNAKVTNLPPPPGTKVTWKVIGNTCDDSRIPGKAQCAIDGNPRTLWHSHPEPFNTSKPLPPPQSIVVDCTAAIEMKGFTYTPRMDGCPDGLVDLCEFQVSNDGKNWTLAARCEFKDIAQKRVPQKVAFERPVKARYFRFTACRAIPPNDRIAVAEIDVW